MRKYRGFPHPDYDSGWRYMDPGEYEIVLTHNLGSGYQHYSFVDLIIGYPNNIRSPTWQRYYDQFKQPPQWVQKGYKWDHFNDYTITVTRHYDETEDSFRLRIWTWS